MSTSYQEDLLQRTLSTLPPRGRRIPSAPRDVEMVLEDIHTHLFTDGLSLHQIYERTGLHNHNITSRFKLHIGVGIREYIEQERIGAAKALLKHPDLHVYLIADAVGYAYVETFMRAFHRQAGCTPGEYRRQLRGEQAAEDPPYRAPTFPDALQSALPR